MSTPNKIGGLTIKRGRSKAKPRYVIYGAGSVGKTTLASTAPKPLFLCLEDGAREFDVDYVEFEPGRSYPTSFDETLTALERIAAGDVGDLETLVLDGFHQLDILIQTKVLSENNKWKSIQEAGFGKGEAEVLSKWRLVVAKLDEINTRKGLRIVLTGHHQIDKFKNPEGAEFNRYDMLVTKHPKGDVAAFLYGWAEVVGFARFETLTQEINKRTVAVAVQGDRLLQLAWTNAYQAKCRLGGPDLIPLTRDGVPRPWSEIFGEMENKDPDVLRAAIESLLPSVDDATQAKVRGWLPTVHNDVGQLAKGLENMKKKIEQGKAAA